MELPAVNITINVCIKVYRKKMNGGLSKEYFILILLVLEMMTIEININDIKYNFNMILAKEEDRLALKTGRKTAIAIITK